MASVYPPTWERTLLPLAYEAEEQEEVSAPFLLNDTAVLNRAYAYCAALTSRYSRTFFLATELLPTAKRRAMRALYAFCRVSDDLQRFKRVAASVVLRPLPTGKEEGSVICAETLVSSGWFLKCSTSIFHPR